MTLTPLPGGDAREWLIRLHERAPCHFCQRRTGRRMQLDSAFPDWWLPICARCSGVPHLSPVRPYTRLGIGRLKVEGVGHG